MTAPPPFSGVLFGAAYYAEYQPRDTVDRDLDLMAAADFTVIRVGESVWSTWEPQDGVFDLDWLQPVLDGAHARGISVILGTPTYAVPPWLHRLHPEIAAETSTGHRVGWGARQEMDQSHPAYRFYAERIVRKVIQRYAQHPAVIGFQVDNEPGIQLPHNEQTFQRFVSWLRARYGTVERLNTEWGLTYWSHRLSDWSELWRPDGNSSPQYQLEWRRFQSTLATELIAWQSELVHEYARPDQFVTTCISYTRPQLADDQLVASLDVVAGNPYYKMQDGLDFGRDEPRVELWHHESVWGLFQWADRAWSSGQSPFLVTETNAQSIGQTQAQNFPPFPGQIKQAALALLARGGRMIEYWHWHTLHSGIETYWGGVLPHSQQPGRVYREVADLGKTLKALGTALDDYVPDSDVLMLWSTDTKWSFEFFPPLSKADGTDDPHSYWRIFDAYYRGLFEAGAQVRVQHVRQFLDTDVDELVRRFKVLVAPALYVADDEVLEHLKAYAEAGGHLVLGVRTAYADELARARLAVAPAVLSEPAGVWYDEFSNLDHPLLIDAETDFDLEAGSAGTDWVEALQPTGADVLLRYTPTELGADAALTSRRSGSGRVSYLGTVPNAALGHSLSRWLVPTTHAAAWRATETVTVSTGTSGADRIVFVSNWSTHSTNVIAPTAVTDLVSGAAYEAGDEIPLERRGVAVLKVPYDSAESSASPLKGR